MSSPSSQIGGTHYSDRAIQPIEYINANELSPEYYKRLCELGLIPTKSDSVRAQNVGTSNYSSKTIQPWSIWLDYPELTSWDHDIIKRTLRTKETDSRALDYQKIIHICQERLRQLNIHT